MYIHYTVCTRCSLCFMYMMIVCSLHFMLYYLHTINTTVCLLVPGIIISVKLAVHLMPIILYYSMYSMQSMLYVMLFT